MSRDGSERINGDWSNGLFHLLINGVLGLKPTDPNHLLTSWDIQEGSRHPHHAEASDRKGKMQHEHMTGGAGVVTSKKRRAATRKRNSDKTLENMHKNINHSLDSVSLYWFSGGVVISTCSTSQHGQHHFEGATSRFLLKRYLCIQTTHIFSRFRREHLEFWYILPGYLGGGFKYFLFST